MHRTQAQAPKNMRRKCKMHQYAKPAASHAYKMRRGIIFAKFPLRRTLAEVARNFFASAAVLPRGEAKFPLFYAGAVGWMRREGKNSIY